MPRIHRLFHYGTKDTATIPPFKPYRRRRYRTREQALRAAGLGTARRPPAPDGRTRDA